MKEQVDLFDLMGEEIVQENVLPPQGAKDLFDAPINTNYGQPQQQPLSYGGNAQQQMNPMGNMQQQPMNPMGNMHQPMNPIGNMQQPMNQMGNMQQQPMNPMQQTQMNPLVPTMNPLVPNMNPLIPGGGSNAMQQQQVPKKVLIIFLKI